MKESEEEKYVVLERDKHFTLTSLAEFLNKKFTKKETGGEYTPMDVKKYVRRGHLPIHLGGNALTEMRDEGMGLKMIVMGDPMEIKKGKKKKTV